MSDEREVEEIPELPRPTRWGLVVIGLAFMARVTESAAEMVEAASKFWCELAMAAAGQSNHEAHQREFAREAAIEIETLLNGAHDAGSSETRRD